MALLGFYSLIVALTTVILFVVLLRRRRENVVAFFHPTTNDGGGGERVLWCAVRAMQELLPGMQCAVYSGDETSPEMLEARALQQFGVQLHSRPKVVKLRMRKLAESSTYPRFTLICQSLGSILLGLEALWQLTPFIFFDTSGYAFTYFFARLFGCKVVCYTHYPTISSDMISRVSDRSTIYNNSSTIAKSQFLSSAKLIYYKIVAWLYGLAGQCSNLTMVNSSWTQSHIETLWGVSERIVRVYPPCSTESLQELPLTRNEEPCYFISVAQFRPEKNHILQLEAFLGMRETLRMKGVPDNKIPRLKLVGSCRNKEDEARLQSLKNKCHQLQIEEHVDFCVNVPYRRLMSLLGGATAGLHTMIDEHFGISVVEYMAAGAVAIAHNSAGPMKDIVVDEDGEKTGFLALSVTEYSDAMVRVSLMSNEERLKISAAARRRVALFSEARFDDNFKAAMSAVLHTNNKQKL